MKEYADAYFFLNLKKEDGGSEADGLARILENLENRKGAQIDAKKEEIRQKLYLPDLPEEYAFVWNDFFSLHASRSSNGFGSNPISYLEIDAYTRLTKRVLLPYEIAAIQIIDNCFLSAQGNLSKAAQKSKGASPTPQAASKESASRRR